MDRCTMLHNPAISDLHSIDSGIASVYSWKLLSQTLRGWSGGLLRLTIGFLPSLVCTIRRRASCAGTPGSRCTTWVKQRYATMVYHVTNGWQVRFLEHLCAGDGGHQRISSNLSQLMYRRLQCVHVGGQTGHCYCTIGKRMDHTKWLVTVRPYNRWRRQRHPKLTGGHAVVEEADRLHRHYKEIVHCSRFPSVIKRTYFGVDRLRGFGLGRVQVSIFWLTSSSPLQQPHIGCQCVMATNWIKYKNLKVYNEV